MKNAAPTTARTSHFLCWSSVMFVGNEARWPGIPSVAKVSTPGEDHSRSRPLYDRCNFGVPFGAARLDDRRHAARESLLRPVREREEGIRSEHRSLEVVTELLGLLEGQAHGVDAALLACADPDRLQVIRDHDRVRPDVLAHPPREK